MTYHHVPGHPVADIYEQADLERQIEAVDFWQDEAFFHPLTCGNKSSHALLRGAERDDRAVMICPTCGYRQDLIPDVVFVAYRHRREIVRARQRFAGNRNYRSAVEEAYADGGLDPEDESLPGFVKNNLRRIWSEKYHHTSVPPHVWDIYAEYLERSRLQQAMIDSRKQWESIMARGKASVAARLNSVATEHPIEAEEGWLGCTDFESDDPGGWAR